LTLVLVATVLFMWVIFAHSTPDERARLHDRWVPARALRGDSIVPGSVAAPRLDGRDIGEDAVPEFVSDAL